MSSDRETPLPNEPITREYQRSIYLVEAVELLVAALLEADPSKRKGLSHYHLGLAYDAGASRDVEYRTAIAMLQSTVRILQETVNKLEAQQVRYEERLAAQQARIDELERK